MTATATRGNEAAPTPEASGQQPFRPVLPSPPDQVGTTVLTDGRHIGWAVFGDPDGDTVFWFHGTPGARHQLPAGAAEAARERHLRIVGVERPGTGHSTPHRYRRIVDFVPDLEAVADDLGVDRFALVGLSGGGPFVLAVAHELPERVTSGIVLGGIGPTRGSDAVISHTLLLVPAAGLVDRYRAGLASGTARLFRAMGPYGGPVIDAFFKVLPGERRHMGADHLSKRQMLHDLIDAVHRAGLGAPFDDLVLFGKHWGIRLDRITVPIWFWGGTSDIIVPYLHAERQAKRVPASRLRTAEGRGHFAGYTEPDEVLDAIREDWPDTRATRSRRRKAG